MLGETVSPTRTTRPITSLGGYVVMGAHFSGRLPSPDWRGVALSPTGGLPENIWVNLISKEMQSRVVYNCPPVP